MHGYTPLMKAGGRWTEVEGEGEGVEGRPQLPRPMPASHSLWVVASAEPTLFRSRSFSSRHSENWRFHCSTLAADSCSAEVSRALLSLRVCSSISHFFTLAALWGRGQAVTGVVGAIHSTASHPLSPALKATSSPTVAWPQGPKVPQAWRFSLVGTYLSH